MLFNSYVFIFAFLPLVLAGWWLWREHPHRRLAFLTLASYFFYGWWNWRFVPLMIASTAVDHLAALRIDASEDPRVRCRWLICSMTFNLTVLGIFKYLGFFMDSTQRLLQAVNIEVAVPVWHILLPIGISFYTFNSMSYTIDVYRGLVKPAPSLLQFSAFVAMFPHLVAGPIVRWADMEHQFQRLKRVLTHEQASRGLYLFSLGMAKKLLLADQLAGPVNAFFHSPYDYGATASWILVTGYGLQLYFDFSGYSDMAVGLAHLLGLQFPQNFNSPYKAESISDFWRRWHISLSTWLRDYLFLPLLGNHRGRGYTLFAIAVTMFLGGLWHGAQWTFVLWGIWHGALLVVNHTIGRPFFQDAPRRRRSFIVRAAALVVTYLAVTVGWALFRATSLAQAWALVTALLTGRGGLQPALVPASGLAVVLALLVGFWIVQLGKDWVARSPRLLAWWAGKGLRLAPALRLLVYAGMLYLVFILNREPRDFVYFQF